MKIFRSRTLMGAAAALATAMALAWPASGMASQESVSLEVGSPAPDFELEALDGEPLRLSALEGEKNVIVVFFRGAW